MDKVLNDYRVIQNIEIPETSISEEERAKIMRTVIKNYINTEKIQSWDEFKMMLDFVSMEDFPMITSGTRDFIEKYGLDKIIESGLDIKYLFQDIKLTNIKEIANLSGIKLEGIDEFVKKQLLEYGIKDQSELYEVTNDLKQVKKMLEKRPLYLIDMGTYSDEKKKFIERYGIDNILALDEETGGIFSHEMWSNDIYLTLMARAERSAPKLDVDKNLTYEEFRNRMYDILLHARDERAPLRSKDYPNYDFIQGKFREEHPDIFLDGDLPENVKQSFYTGYMTAELIRQNPNLIQLLQGKDLSRTFPQNMVAGFSLEKKDESGNVIGGIPNRVNMAQYLSEKLGQEEFLKICADYGKCLDCIKLNIMSVDEISVGSVREKIEQAIYKEIKEQGIEYFEELPLSFQEKHPDLFLPKEINKELRNKFYAGKLSFEDIRQNPQIKDLLLTKDIRRWIWKIEI